MEYEFTMSLTNLHLDPEIETVFLMAKEEYSHVSSSLLRQIAALGGDLSKFLPELVKKALIDKAQSESWPFPELRSKFHCPARSGRFAPPRSRNPCHAEIRSRDRCGRRDCHVHWLSGRQPSRGHRIENWLRQEIRKDIARRRHDQPRSHQCRPLVSKGSVVDSAAQAPIAQAHFFGINSSATSLPLPRT